MSLSVVASAVGGCTVGLVIGLVSRRGYIAAPVDITRHIVIEVPPLGFQPTLAIGIVVDCIITLVAVVLGQYIRVVAAAPIKEDIVPFSLADLPLVRGSPSVGSYSDSSSPSVSRTYVPRSKRNGSSGHR